MFRLWLTADPPSFSCCHSKLHWPDWQHLSPLPLHLHKIPQACGPNCWSSLGLTMGRVWCALCTLLASFTAVQSAVTHRDAGLALDFVGFYKNLEPFSFERNLDFTPCGAVFSSRQSWTPDLHGLAGFSPFPNVPGVQVYCDAAALTVLVDKRIGGLKLTGEEMHLGSGCFSNGELANQYVFSYGFDECGTTTAVSIQSSVLHFCIFMKL